MMLWLLTWCGPNANSTYTWKKCKNKKKFVLIRIYARNAILNKKNISRFVNTLNVFHLTCNVYIISSIEVWAPSGGIISKLVLKVCITTLQRTFPHTNDGNRFNSRDREKFEMKGGFLTHFFRPLPSLNRLTDLNKLCFNSSNLISCCVWILI